MSRAHMLYDNQALSSLPVRILDWGSLFDESKAFNTATGRGVIAQGIIKNKARITIVQSGSNKKHRFLVFVVDIEKAFRRRFDADGAEIEPDFASTKKVNTGFLMSSYKSVATEGEDVLNPYKVADEIKVDSQISNANQKHFSMLSDPQSKSVAFWCYESDYENIDLPVSALIRLRTKGAGSLMESITWLDQEKSTLSSYSSEQPVGGSWTDKVMGAKGGASDVKDVIPQTKDNQGADDNEWDD